MPFAATSLLLLDPVAERVLASWDLVRMGRAGDGARGAAIGGWALDLPRLRALVQADAVTIDDALARLDAMDLLEPDGTLRGPVTAYLSRRTLARLGGPRKTSG